MSKNLHGFPQGGGSAAEVTFWEDLTLGDRWSSPGRTITETDVVHFAMLSGDWTSIHTDRELAADTIFGERVAHGILGVAIQTGLMSRIPEVQRMQGAFLALLGLDWSFPRPILFNDTIHLDVVVAELRATSRPDRGVVVLRREVVNQRGEIVQVGTTPLLIKRRGPQHDAEHN